MSLTQNKTKGLIYALACIFLWSLIPVVAKLGQSSLDQYQFLFWSSLTSLSTLSVITTIQKKWAALGKLRLRDLLIILTLGFMGTFLYYLLLYQGYRTSSGLSVLAIQYTWPLFIALLAPVFLPEKFSWHRSIALLLGFSGVILVISKGEPGQITQGLSPQLLWVATGSLCFALFSILSKKVSYEPVSLNTLYFLVAALCSGLSLVFNSDITWPERTAWVSILVNGILINGVSYLFWIKALRLQPANQLAVLVFMTPVLSTIFLLVFFTEPFKPVYLIGMLFIVMAGWLSSKN